MPLAYVSRSAIGRGLRRTGCGQEWTFDNFVRIVDNPKMSARLRPQPVFFYPSVLEPPFRLDLLL
jgi:hypothetical protein